MSVVYNKTKAGGVCIEEFHSSIDESSISTGLEQIVVNDNFYIILTFEESLTVQDENILDYIIENHDCNDDEDGVNDFDDFATVQVTNIENLELHPSVYNNLELPKLLVKNKPLVVEDLSPDDTPSRILVKESGMYNVSFNGILEANIVQTHFKLVILRDNQIIDIPGSEHSPAFNQALPWIRYGYGKQNHIFDIDIDLNSILVANDIISIQAFKEKTDYSGSRYASYYPQQDYATAATLLPNSILSVTKLSGPVGPAGEAGKAGNSDLEIKLSGAIKGRNIDKLNFVGNVTVQDDGNDQTTITVLSNQSQFLMYQLDGADYVKSEPMAFLIDPTRRDSILSVETSTFQFGEHSVNNNDWFYIHNASNTDAAYAMPYDGTIIRISGGVVKSKGENTITLFVNADSNDVLTFYPDNYPSTDHCTDANIKFNKNDTIRIKNENRNGRSGNLYDCVVTVWVKWEVRSAPVMMR